MIKIFKTKLIHFFSFISAIISLIAFTIWVPPIFMSSSNKLCLIAASFILPHNHNISDFNFENKHGTVTSEKDIFSEVINFTNKQSFENKKTENTADDNNILEILNSVPAFELPHSENETTKKIIECSFGVSGIKHENFYINNQTNTPIDIDAKLKEIPDIKIKKDGNPEVLIVHTHTTEAYMDKDQGFYYQNFSPRTKDPRFNVVQVGDAICKSLENSGIKCHHDITCHDDPTYTGSYKRAEETISKNLNRYPSIQVVLDIHRDTIENKEKRKIKPTFTYNGRKGAQIMIISGCDANGRLEFPDWQYNLSLALRLHKEVETMYPGMTRSLLFKEARYNMHKTHGSLLIEVGSDVNTLNEAVYSGALLGKALGEVLNKLC